MHLDSSHHSLYDEMNISKYMSLKVYSVFFQTGLGINPWYFSGNNQNCSLTLNITYMVMREWFVIFLTYYLIIFLYLHLHFIFEWYPALFQTRFSNWVTDVQNIGFWSHNLVPQRNIEVQKTLYLCRMRQKRQQFGWGGFCRTTCVAFPWWESATTSASELVDMQSCHAVWLNMALTSETTTEKSEDRDRWKEDQMDRWRIEELCSNYKCDWKIVGYTVCLELITKD